MPASASEAARWWFWLLELWRGNEDQWVKEEVLQLQSPTPWTTALEFDPSAISPRERHGSMGGHRSKLKDSRLAAGFPGLSWRLVSVSGSRSMGALWSSMLEGLYMTSAFNPGVDPERDADIWHTLEARFALRWQRQTRYRYLVAQRDEFVRSSYEFGSTVRETAEVLVRGGLHPVERRPYQRASYEGLSRQQQNVQVDNAERIVLRTRRRLASEGLIPTGKPGRPRKKSRVTAGEQTDRHVWAGATPVGQKPSR